MNDHQSIDTRPFLLHIQIDTYTFASLTFHIYHHLLLSSPLSRFSLSTILESLLSTYFCSRSLSLLYLLAHSPTYLPLSTPTPPTTNNKGPYQSFRNVASRCPLFARQSPTHQRLHRSIVSVQPSPRRCASSQCNAHCQKSKEGG